MSVHSDFHSLRKLFHFFKKQYHQMMFFLSIKPKTQPELIHVLRHACTKKIIDNNTLNRIEGILEVPTLRVKDVMIPRAQMSTVKQTAQLKALLPIIIETAHSRFPVIGENADDIIGILLAKDLLLYAFHEKTRFNMQTVLREATFVPENKRLDILLQEFRMNRNHMAIVVDEYGGISGLITIEDVLEQIVGNIEDEYDDDFEKDTFIKPQGHQTYSIKALTPMSTFNHYFQTHLSLDDVDTLGGFVIRHFNHLPKRGEKIQIEDFQFKILRADNRRIHLLQMVHQPKTPPPEQNTN